MKEILAKLFKRLWRIVSHNLALKLLSLLIAVLLWNSVISSDTGITRSKTLTNLTGYISGQAVLGTYGLAMLSDPSDMLQGITVKLEVPQKQYANVSQENVQVMLDLSSIHNAGTQEVHLKATSSYGRVTEIIPDTLTLTFESQDSRQVPVNVQLVGAADNMWYNVSGRNPSVLTVSGAGSVVRSIASAYVYVDVSERTEKFTVSELFSLVDSAGEELSQTMLTRSSSSISVTVEVYPTKNIALKSDIASVVTGQPADGYVIESVTLQPESVVVAADAELLDGISELQIEPVSVEGATQSVTARAKVSKLSTFKNLSAEEVYVSVVIAEEKTGAWITPVWTFINKGEDVNISTCLDDTKVYVSGPKSVVEGLKENGFVVTIDLAGLTKGEYKLTPAFPTADYPDVTFTTETETVDIVLE